PHRCPARERFDHPTPGGKGGSHRPTQERGAQSACSPRRRERGLRWKREHGIFGPPARGRVGGGSKNMTKNHFRFLGALIALAALNGTANAQGGVEPKLQVCSSCHGV